MTNALQDYADVRDIWVKDHIMFLIVKYVIAHVQYIYVMETKTLNFKAKYPFYKEVMRTMITYYTD